MKFTQTGALDLWGQYVFNSGIVAVCLAQRLRDHISYAELSQEVS